MIVYCSIPEPLQRDGESERAIYFLCLDSTFSLSANQLNQSIMFAGVIFLLSLFVAVVHGVNSAADLVGTWTTKSRSVVTGPVCV